MNKRLASSYKKLALLSTCCNEIELYYVKRFTKEDFESFISKVVTRERERFPPGRPARGDPPGTQN